MGEGFTRFRVQPITGTIGAEIFGLDLSRDHTPETIAELKQAVDRYHVLAVRQQNLSRAEYHELRKAFGPFSGNPVHESTEEFEDIVILNREPEDTGKVIGEDWHMDLAWLAKPPGITMLYGEAVPPYGGDTCFTSLEQPYRVLSPGMRRLIAPLVSVHAARNVLAAQYGGVKVRADAVKIGSVEVEHPLVCVNPRTGRPYLFLSSVIDRFVGMTAQESRPIVDYLLSVATRPEFHCRLRWQPGTLGMWLNPCVMHTAINDYAGHRRRMLRTTIEGWTPVAAGDASLPTRDAA
jgi:alpha-ketoglutarate-dependent taurine dioxygenase